MKKLLMLGAILALGATMAYGAENKEITTDVKVIAEIVNESFVITDLDGNPIILDFGKIPGNAYTLDKRIKEVSEGYKITYVGPNGDATNFSGKGITMTLKDTDQNSSYTEANGSITKVAQVIMRRQISSGDNGNDATGKETKITSNIFLDKYDGKLNSLENPGDIAYVGQIGGYIKGTDLGSSAPASGDYEGFALLTVTVAD